MGKQNNKHKQRCVARPRDILILNCLIHGPGKSSEQCKVLNNFGTSYAASRTFEELIQEPTSDKSTRKNQEINTIV